MWNILDWDSGKEHRNICWSIAFSVSFVSWYIDCQSLNKLSIQNIQIKWRQFLDKTVMTQTSYMKRNRLINYVCRFRGMYLNRNGTSCSTRIRKNGSPSNQLWAFTYILAIRAGTCSIRRSHSLTMSIGGLLCLSISVKDAIMRI